jgi:uncharacterized protein (DUF39 family)
MPDFPDLDYLLNEELVKDINEAQVEKARELLKKYSSAENKKESIIKTWREFQLSLDLERKFKQRLSEELGNI